MKWLLLLGMSCLQGFSSDEKPVYFSKALEGFAMTGFSQYQSFRLEPGTLSNCNSSGHPEFNTFLCTIENSSALLSTTRGTSIKIRVEKIVVTYRLYQGTYWRDYVYEGVFEDTFSGFTFSGAARLVLTTDAPIKDQIRGFIEFPRYGITYGLEVRP